LQRDALLAAGVDSELSIRIALPERVMTGRV
jgi:hypothetical protein